MNFTIRSGQRAVIAVAAVSVVSLAAAQAPTRSPDPRLGRTVAAAQLAGTIGDYLGALSEDTEVRHRADEPFDQRGLVALNIDASLRRLHQGLARTYELSWKAERPDWDQDDDAPEYRLYQSEVNAATRQRALQAEVQRGRQSVMARWDYIARLASLPPEQLRAIADAGEPKAQSLLSPRSGEIMRLATNLPADALSELWRSGSVKVPVAGMSPQLQQFVRGAVLGTGRVLPDPDIFTREGVFHLNAQGRLDRPTVIASIVYGRDAMSSNILYHEAPTFGEREPPADRRQGLVASRVPRDRRFRQKVTLMIEERNPKADPRLRPGNAKPLAVLLQDLGGQVDVPILADCEHKPGDLRWKAQQEWLAESIEDKPLAEALDLLCADFQYEWRFVDGFLTLRPRLWFATPEQRSYKLPRLILRAP